jgi:hypothetical protein
MLFAKRFAIGFGIAVALPVFINVGVDMVSKAPVYSDYHHGTSENAFETRNPAQQAQFDKDQAAYDRAETIYQDRLFAVAVPVGLVAIIIGSMLGATAVSPGLMFGGIFSVIEGFEFCWDKVPEPVRFVSLLVTLALLVYVGMKRIDPDKPVVSHPATSG